MLRRQGYQFEAMPNGEQLRHLRGFAGSCRFVYNQALALNQQRYEAKEKRLGYADLCALLPQWKLAHPWLADTPSQALQQSLKDLERAWMITQNCAFHPRSEGRGFTARIWVSPSWQLPTEGIPA
jgi:putative transposase